MRPWPQYERGPKAWPPPSTLIVYPDGRQEVVQLGRESGCIGTMIERLTSPASCVIATAGDSSWCQTCGHKFDTNSEDNNLPPRCRGALDPFRGGALE